MFAHRRWYPRDVVGDAVVLLLLALLLLAPQNVPAAQESPNPSISRDELFLLVRSESLFSKQQVLEMVQSRGIGFLLTKSIRKELKKQGASAALLEALDQAAEELKHRSGGRPPGAGSQSGSKTSAARSLGANSITGAGAPKCPPIHWQAAQLHLRAGHQTQDKPGRQRLLEDPGHHSGAAHLQ